MTRAFALLARKLTQGRQQVLGQEERRPSSGCKGKGSYQEAQDGG